MQKPKHKHAHVIVQCFAQLSWDCIVDRVVSCRVMLGHVMDAMVCAVIPIT